MVGQHDHRVDDEGVSLACVAECLAQHIDMVNESRPAAVGEIDGEEVRSAGDEGAAVVGHP